jgi:2-polyprenyl-3-methyl-5-hydroxy-6-metoxy-1,4-benzoquinol methylase
VQCGTVPGVRLPEAPFDVVTLLGVLDHIPDPLTTLRTLHAHLARPGVLIASVPNAASAARRAFGENWPGWDLPRHQNHFTPASLDAMLRKAGFDAVRFMWKRRTSRWQDGARLKARTSPGITWRLLARHRTLCSGLAALMARGERSDEIVAVATHIASLTAPRP